MASWISIGASRLHERRLVSGETRIDKATLFPFFDGGGAVHQVLIVDAGSADLRTFRIGEAGVVIPHWGTLRLGGSVRVADEHDIDRLGRLWHYDPWWLLKDVRFASLPATPILKATNCVDSFEERPQDILFSICLSRLNKVRFSVPASEYKTKRFEASMLPKRSAPPRSEGGSNSDSGWRLDPHW
ncbi:MAG: hypothetical protein QGG36_17140 [Pirellulaceae bacterium]|jgi:hypothetical protein|nr:hypothetical protein [Pirellulaceae bacterium]